MAGGKRKRPSDYFATAGKKFKKPSTSGYPPRRGYSSVPRTRGVYATGEMKYFDTELSSTPIPAAATLVGGEFPPNVGVPNTLVAPTVGSAINQRIGRRIKLHKLTVRFVITVAEQINQAGADVASNIRCWLIQDMQTNAGQAQLETIFTAPTNVVNAPNCFQSLDTLGRFRVWKDKMITFQDPSVTFDGTNIEQGGLAKMYKFSLKFKKPIEVSFNAVNGGTISDIVDHSFCVYAICSDVTLAPQIAYYARAYYKE